MAAAVLQALMAIVLVAGTWFPIPALAAQDDVAPTPSELVDQALQVLRDTPEDLPLVMELIRAALEIEAEGPTGTVRNLELQSAIVAIRRGNVREADLRLVAALGPDPHAKHHDPLASEPPEPAQDTLPSVTPFAELDVGPASTGALTLAPPGDNAAGWGWARILGYVILAVATVVLGREAAVERRRTRA